MVTVSGSAPFIDSAGRTNYWPSYVFLLSKVDPNAVGDSSIAQFTNGSGPTLSGTTLALSSVQVPATTGPEYYFINHNNAGLVGSFNVNILGTRL